MSKLLRLFILSAFAALPLIAEEVEDIDKKPTEEIATTLVTENENITEEKVVAEETQAVEEAEEVVKEEAAVSSNKKPTDEMKDSPKEDKLFAGRLDKPSEKVTKEDKLFADRTCKPSEEVRNEKPSEKLFI